LQYVKAKVKMIGEKHHRRGIEDIKAFIKERFPKTQCKL
jgi:hypothetical protein